MNNLHDLLSKLQSIEENAMPPEEVTVGASSGNIEQPEQPEEGGAGASDESMAECGDDGMSAKGNVTMSMQDLLALMNHLQKGHDTPLMGDEEEAVGEEYANAMQGDAGPETMPLPAVTPTGDDMFSKGKEALKVNGGGNPMESALAELYAQIKARPVIEAKKAKKDYDGDGKIESEKDEVWGSRMKAAKKAGKLEESFDIKSANQLARKLRK